MSDAVTVKMQPPEGHTHTTGLKKNKDGTFDIPRDRVQEMKNIHGFSIFGETPMLGKDEMEKLGGPAAKQIAVLEEKCGRLQAEVNTLRSELAQAHGNNQNLSAQVRRLTKAKP